MTEEGACYLTRYDGGIRLVVKAKPGSSRARPPRLVALAEGQQAVEIAVAAIAEDGKANAALLAEVARLFGVKKKDVSLKVGASSRHKLVDVAGDPDLLASVAHKRIGSLPPR